MRRLQAAVGVLDSVAVEGEGGGGSNEDDEGGGDSKEGEFGRISSAAAVLSLDPHHFLFALD